MFFKLHLIAIRVRTYVYTYIIKTSSMVVFNFINIVIALCLYTGSYVWYIIFYSSSSSIARLPFQHSVMKVTLTMGDTLENVSYTRLTALTTSSLMDILLHMVIKATR